MRTILHCDINNCFASIEMLREPGLRVRPLAVCGDPGLRRGIVLAKSESAKVCGVKTGDTLWQAREKCPNIQFVKASFGLYGQYARRFRQILLSLTPRVEPCGLDECWLDMTGDMARFGVDEGVLGDWLRVHIKRHLGLTVSVGVSFNKVFAKLASDLKKPDAVTVIGFEDFSVRVSGVGVSQLLGVGRQTAMKLRRCGIQTIGQLARSDVCFLRGMFGKCGEDLWRHANGLDASPVRTPQESSGRQTLGHGTTLPFDYADAASLWPVVLQLSERVWHGLVAEGLRTRGLALTVRDASLRFHLYQCRFRHCLVSSANMAGLVLMMLRQQYDWLLPVRAIQVRALYLESVSAPRQGELFAQAGVGQWLESGGQAIDAVMGTINGRLGSHTLRRASLLKGISTQPCLMPGVSVPGGDSLD